CPTPTVRAGGWGQSHAPPRLQAPVSASLAAARCPSGRSRPAPDRARSTPIVPSLPMPALLHVLASARRDLRRRCPRTLAHRITPGKAEAKGRDLCSARKVGPEAGSPTDQIPWGSGVAVSLGN